MSASQHHAVESICKRNAVAHNEQPPCHVDDDSVQALGRAVIDGKPNAVALHEQPLGQAEEESLQAWGRAVIDGKPTAAAHHEPRP